MQPLEREGHTALGSSPHTSFGQSHQLCTVKDQGQHARLQGPPRVTKLPTPVCINSTPGCRPTVRPKRNRISSEPTLARQARGAERPRLPVAALQDQKVRDSGEEGQEPPAHHRAGEPVHVEAQLIPQGSQPPGQLVLLASNRALPHRGGTLRQLAELVQHL